MKKRLFIGIVLLLLLAIGGFFAIRNNTPKEENSMNAITDTHEKQNSPEAILATLSPEDQEFVKKDYEEKMQRMEASGHVMSETFKKTYWEAVQESANSDDISDLDDHQSVVYYENEIRKAKKEGGSEEHIASLEGLRDFYVNSIARWEEFERQSEEIDRETQADLARLQALSTLEEKTAYYQEKLQEKEEELLEEQEELRLAKEKGDPARIEWAELLVEAAESRVETQKRRLAWVPKEHALDARIKEWEEVKRPQLIEKYRDILVIEEIDGVERIVGVRSHAEIMEYAKKFLSDSTPSESSSVPSLPETQSTPKLQQTAPERSVDPPSPQGEASPQQSPAAAMESIVNAQTQFQSWREDVDNDYMDVLVSQYMTPQQLEQFFPTEADRQNLTKRTERLQQDVVSKVRKIVSEIPNATQAQKSKLARELVTANFDKDFADAVLSELEKDAE